MYFKTIQMLNEFLQSMFYPPRKFMTMAYVVWVFRKLMVLMGVFSKNAKDLFAHGMDLRLAGWIAVV